MRVVMDFDAKYATEADPWSIGDAHSARYDLYRERLLALARSRSAILDVGSGFGAFLARFEHDFARLEAIEVAPAAIVKGRRRFAFIEFMHGSAAALDTTAAHDRRYGAIVFSDVISYLEGAPRAAALDWIADHLEDEGIALIATYCPNARHYLTGDEFAGLVRERFAVVEEHRLDSEHVALYVRRRRSYVALTIDYETWHPWVPAGRTIDWEVDVFAPTGALLDACDRHAVPVTLFAELAEYFWLAHNDPPLARRMEEQWRDAVQRGHDVQLHVHPSWLPELGARRTGGAWHWDQSIRRMDDYPGDLTELIHRCRLALERAIRPVDPGYELTCFRAGGCEAQPFSRLYEALTANGISCDSSVFPGGHSDEYPYDYRLAYSDHQPYFASRCDPQLKAPPAERGIVELPILALNPGTAWTFDSTEGAHFADELLAIQDEARDGAMTPELRRLLERARAIGRFGYAALRSRRRLVNRLLPAALSDRLGPSYTRERLVADDYYVLIGHSKNDLDIAAIEDGLERLAARVEFATLRDLERRARPELEAAMSPSRGAEASRQIACEYDAVMGDERNDAQSARLQDHIPHDRLRVLDLGCGAGDWSARIARRLPLAEVVGVDVGPDFIARATARHASARIRFAVQDMGALTFADASFDCVYADNSLEHAFDVDGTLVEICRVLADGGIFVAAIPSDARNPARTCENHTWKTAPHDVCARLADAGFDDIAISELDVHRRLGMAPYPPSRNRMMYVRAWKRGDRAPGQAAIAADLMHRFRRAVPATGASPAAFRGKAL